MGFSMKVTYHKKYKSITELHDFEMPNFALLLGKNGSGKTHFLKAIEENSISVDNLAKKDVIYFNTEKFKIGDHYGISLKLIEEQKKEAWNTIKNLKMTMKSLYDDKIKKIINSNEARPYAVKLDSISASEQIHYNENINAIESLFPHKNTQHPIYNILKSTMQYSEQYFSEMDEKYFYQLIENLSANFSLAENISEIFLDYHIKNIMIEDHESMAIPPWDFFNEILKEYGLKHRINKPEIKQNDLLKKPSETFRAKLFVDSDEISFDELSSGEKILCALAMTLYQKNRTNFPKLILLDEIDTVLHPTAIENFLNVLNDVFISHDCKIILATHSPTTVALFKEENNLYEITKKDTKTTINNIQKKDAIDLLSEGLMSLSKVMNLFDSIFRHELTIISEGNNSEHIEHAFKILKKHIDESTLNKIHFYQHPSGSGEADLFGLMEFIKKTNITKKVLFVWDCDVKKKYGIKSETDTIFKYRFDKNNSNKIFTKGIENLYPNKYCKEWQEKYGITQPSGEKTRFLNDYIKITSSEDIFSNFIDLTKIANNILEHKV